MKTKGWREVFAFTFTQQIKTKSFIIGTIVITLIAALIAATANILPAFFIDSKVSESGSGEDTFSIKTLYLSNETDYAFDLTAAMEKIGVTVSALSSDEAEKKIAELADTSEKAMLSRVFVEKDVLSVESKYAGGEKSEVNKGDCEAVSQLLATQLHAQFLVLSGLPEDKLVTAMAGVRATISCAGEEPEGFVTTMIKSIVPMLSAIVLFIFIFSYSQLVAQAIAIEKSSRIVEYLLTSIRPLALIIGKVLAMCCVSLMQFVIIGMGGGLGFLLSMPFGIFTKMDKIAEAAGGAAALTGSQLEAQNVLDEIGNAFSGVDASAILVMIVTFILGFLLYAGLAGVAGASVSKMEDLAPAIQPLSIVGVLGFYLAYFPQVAGEENSLSVIARYVPISSPFVLPSDYMLGKISLVETLIAIVVLAVFDILVVMLVAKVYEHIILHTGNRLKLGDMLKMSK